MRFAEKDRDLRSCQGSSRHEARVAAYLLLPLGALACSGSASPLTAEGRDGGDSLADGSASGSCVEQASAGSASGCDPRTEELWTCTLAGAAPAGTCHASAQAGSFCCETGASAKPWTCESPGTLGGATHCSACTFSANASPATCTATRPINACCAWVGATSTALERASGLHDFSSDNKTLDLACLTTPQAQGTSRTVTLTGHVKPFASGGDSAGVKIEIFREAPDGAIGASIGSAVTTAAAPNTLVSTWPTKCPAGGCKLRPFTLSNVPTETPLIVKTSDAAGTEAWADRYEYGVYLANGALDGQGNAARDAVAISAVDLNTFASAAGGFTLRADRGLILGEVHDCGDVRLSGAAVDTDLAHEGEVAFFGDDEGDPLPDKSRTASVGTSKLGIFGMLNLATGTPIRVRAIGTSGGHTLLVGSYVVRAFPGAVTALSMAGRGSWQK